MIYFIFGLLGFLFANIPGLIIGLFIAHYISNIFNFEKVDYSSSLLFETLPYIFGWFNAKIGTSKYFISNVKTFAINNFGIENAKIFMKNVKEYTYSQDIDIKFNFIINLINENLSEIDKINLIKIVKILYSNRIDFTNSQNKFFIDFVKKFGYNPYSFTSETYNDYQYDYQSNNNYNNNRNNETFDPYSVLGIDRNASIEEIKKQYRNLSKQYHPDKFHHLSDSEKLQYEIKMREINRAYDEIKKERGFK